MVINQGDLWKGGDEQGEDRRQHKHLQTTVAPVGLGYLTETVSSHTGLLAPNYGGKLWQ